MAGAFWRASQAGAYGRGVPSGHRKIIAGREHSPEKKILRVAKTKNKNRNPSQIAGREAKTKTILRAPKKKKSFYLGDFVSLFFVVTINLFSFIFWQFKKCSKKKKTKQTRKKEQISSVTQTQDPLRSLRKTWRPPSGDGTPRFEKDVAPLRATNTRNSHGRANPR